MKSVLISIQPKWVEKICKGEKTIEVRKTKPKLETPFKCYIYETKAYDALFGKGKPLKLCVGGGKVIGEFICEKITPLFNVATTSWNLLAGNVHEYAKNLVRKACLTEKEIHDYAKGKDCYAWHISNLKIYDKPKELSEFGQKCDMAYEIRCRDCLIRKGWNECCEVMCKPLTRPPQSWCYVESLGE